MRDGIALVADEGLGALFHTRRESSVPVRVDGSKRWLAKWIARRVSRMALNEPGLEVDL